MMQLLTTTTLSQQDKDVILGSNVVPEARKFLLYGDARKYLDELRVSKLRDMASIDPLSLSAENYREHMLMAQQEVALLTYLISISDSNNNRNNHK